MKSKLTDDLLFGVCKRFEQKNIVTGEIKYKYADMARISEDLCGLNAKYFAYKQIENQNIAITENEFLSKFY